MVALILARIFAVISNSDFRLNSSMLNGGELLSKMGLRYWEFLINYFTRTEKLIEVEKLLIFNRALRIALPLG